jgi:PiT family inorganic phosphate transporter
MSVLYKGLDHFFQRHQIDFGGSRPWGASIALAVLAGVCTYAVLRRLGGGALRQTLDEQLRHVERLFAPLVILTSCSVAFAHGANDVANAVGPVAAIYEIVRTGSVAMKVRVPFGILFLGGMGIVVGVATFGYRVVRTVGTKITQLTPSRGTAADIATMATVLVCTRLKLPVSTTHTIVGAIIGVGMARGLEAVNGRVFRDILYSWFVTVPVAAVLSAVLFFLGREWGLAGWIVRAFPGG